LAQFRSGQGVDIQGRAASATSQLQRSTARLDNIFAESTSKMVEEMAKLIDKVDEWITGSAENTGALQDTTVANNRVADALEKQNPYLFSGPISALRGGVAGFPSK